MYLRQYRSALMAAAMFASAACGSESEKDSGSGTVEIFSWWTGGGEAEALEVLVGGFEDAHPGVAVQNSAVQGGAGTNSQELLRERMESRQPPDLFQIHGGAELIDQWVVVGNDDSQTR